MHFQFGKKMRFSAKVHFTVDVSWYWGSWTSPTRVIPGIPRRCPHAPKSSPFFNLHLSHHDLHHHSHTRVNPVSLNTDVMPPNHFHVHHSHHHAWSSPSSARVNPAPLNTHVMPPNCALRWNLRTYKELRVGEANTETSKSCKCNWSSTFGQNFQFKSFQP